MTYYEILEVSETASAEVIHMAYKALAKKYHPDLFNGDPKIAEQQMARINAAHAVLSDPEERVKYDAFLRYKKSQQQETPHETTAENNEPKQTAEKPKKQKKENTLPGFKRSAITIAILLLFVFFLEFLFYSVLYDYPIEDTIFLAFGDFLLFTFSYTLAPLLIGAIKKNPTINFIDTLSGLNAAIVMTLWNVLNESPGSGWMLMIIYAFINKHIVIQMHQKIQQRFHRILIAGITTLALALASVCYLFAVYVLI